MDSLVDVSLFLEKEQELDEKIKNDPKVRKMYNSRKYTEWLNKYHPGWVNRRTHFESYKLGEETDEILRKK